jgi:hypothetical protein
MEKNLPLTALSGRVYPDVGQGGYSDGGQPMSALFPKVYRSFSEFQRDELRKLDSLRTTVTDMLEERFAEELNFDNEQPRRRRRR